MSESLVFDMSGDSKGAESAFRRLIKENDRLKQAITETNREMEKGEKVGNQWGETFGRSIVSMTAGTLTLAAALRAANAEYQHMLDRQAKASKTVISTADAKMSFQRNLGDATPEEREWWNRQVAAIAKRTAQREADVFVATGEASAAQGNLSREQLAENVTAAFLVAPESAQEATAIAGGLGDTASLTGTGDSLVNMGMMLAAGKQARVANMRMIATNLVPGAIGAQGYGGSAGEAMALTATLTNLMKDQTGAISKTAAISLAGEMDRILGADKSPLEHIRAIQESPALQAKFLKNASLPLEARIPIQQLLTKGSAADDVLTNNLGGYGDAGQMKASAERFITSLGKDPLQIVATQNRQQLSTADALQLGDLPGAVAGTNRGNLGEIMQASGAGYFETKFQQGMFAAQTLAGTDPNAAMAERLRDRASTIRGYDEFDRPRAEAIDPAEEARARKLDEQIAALEANTQAMLENTKARTTSRSRNIDRNTEK